MWSEKSRIASSPKREGGRALYSRSPIGPSLVLQADLTILHIVLYIARRILHIILAFTRHVRW